MGLYEDIIHVWREFPVIPGKNVSARLAQGSKITVNVVIGTHVFNIAVFEKVSRRIRLQVNQFDDAILVYRKHAVSSWFGKSCAKMSG